jgi:hypothetical protein
LELQVFETAGGWVGATSEPRAKLALDRHSAHAAWRAEQWRERLPVLAGVDHPSLIQPPGEAWGRCFSQLATLPGTVARLAALYRVVLPRLALRYRAHLASASVVAEAPTRRTLSMVLADVAGDRDEGDDALTVLLSERSAVEAAAGATVSVETAFLA